MYKETTVSDVRGDEHRIDPSSVAFDIDGVVADTMSLFIEIARNDYAIDTIRYEDIKTYTLEDCLDVDPDTLNAIVQKLLDGTYSETLHPVPDAPAVLSRLGEQWGPLLFVTARPYPGPIVDWLMEHLAVERSAVDIITTGSFDAKADILLNRGVTHFVEDRLETCLILAEKGITPILFRQPWNRGNSQFLEVGSWRELEAMIGFS